MISNILWILLTSLTRFLLITVDEDTRWTAQTYPNPFINIEDCGNSETSPVGDPDSILDLEDRRTVGELARETLTPGSSSDHEEFCRQKSLTIVIALMNRIKSSTSKPASLADTKSFANRLRDRHNFDSQCNKEVLLVFSAKDKTFYCAMGSKTGLRPNAMIHVFNKQKQKLANTRYRDAFIGMIAAINAKYGAVLKQAKYQIPRTTKTSKFEPGGSEKKATNQSIKIPWWVWLVICLVVVPCVCCCCVCYCMKYCMKRGKRIQVPTFAQKSK